MNLKSTILLAGTLLFAQLPLSQEISTSVEIKKDWVDEKIESLSPDTHSLNEDVLRLALAKYKEAKDRNITESNILSVVDFNQTSDIPRLWVIDLFQNRVLFHELVAHGQKSGDHKTATSFSNRSGSHQSSLGLFLTGTKYIGSKGISLSLHGLNPGLNDKAYARRVIVHGAGYVSKQRAQRLGHVGRSWGCFSVRSDISKILIDTIKNGTLIFAYHPQLKTIA